MKNEKLRIKDFLNNELKNQIKIVGGDTPIVDIRPIGGGPSNTGGNGGGDVEDPIGIGNPPPKVDPNQM
jgi:hypothetical protein